MMIMGFSENQWSPTPDHPVRMNSFPSEIFDSAPKMPNVDLEHAFGRESI